MIVESHSDANGAMNEFFYTVRSKLDERLEELLATAKNSPIPPESQSTFVEIVYANRDQFTTGELVPVAAIADFAGSQNFWTMRDGRGAAIARALRDEVLTEGPPEPEAKYLPPPPAPEPLEGEEGAP